MATPEVLKVTDKRHSAIELQPVNVEEHTGITVSPISITPMGMVEIAVRRGANIDELSKLLDLQERWEKREAEKAFVAALAAFKKNPPEIVKNKKVSYTNKQGQLVEYKHATLDRVTGVIAAGLGEHGISADWETAQENGRIRVSCFLQHKQGHREKRASLEGPPDDSGAKSNVQAIVSTVTFLERYTLLAATGLATRDDADGITFADVEDAIASLNSAITLDELQDRFNKAYKRAHAAKDKASMGIIIETKDERKKALLTKNPKAEEQMAEFQKLADGAGLNTAGRNMILGKHNGDITAAIAELMHPPEEVASKTPREEAQASGSPAESKRSARTGRNKQPEQTAGASAQTPATDAAPIPKEGDLGF